MFNVAVRPVFRFDHFLRGLWSDRRTDGAPGQTDGGFLPHPQRDHYEDGLHHHVVSLSGLRPEMYGNAQKIAKLH